VFPLEKWKNFKQLDGQPVIVKAGLTPFLMEHLVEAGKIYSCNGAFFPLNFKISTTRKKKCWN
jgi:hypothetical protein